MPSPIELLLLILANYRLARLVSREEGPALVRGSIASLVGLNPYQPLGVFEALRIKAGAYDRDEQSGEPLTNLGRLFDCPLCVGLWTAVLLIILSKLSGRIGKVIVLWLAIAGGQVFIQTKEH